MSSLLELIDAYVDKMRDLPRHAADDESRYGDTIQRAEAMRAEIERRLSTMVDIDGAEVFSTWYRVTKGPSDAVWMETSDRKEARNEYLELLAEFGDSSTLSPTLWRTRRHLVQGPWERWTEGETR